MRLSLIIVAALVLLYAVLCLALGLFQRSLIYFPQERSAREPTVTLGIAGADLVIGHRPREGATALIYFGGNAEDVGASLPLLAAAYPDHALYLMHYRGYGGSTGKPAEALLQSDARALFDKVAETHKDITLIGRSLGSGIAIQLAASRPAQRLVLITPFDSIENIAAAQFPWLPVRWLLQDRYRSLEIAPRISIPTVLVQAEHDTVIPPASTSRLLQAFAPGVARRIIIAGAGHYDIQNSPGYLAAIKPAKSAGTAPDTPPPPAPR